MNRRRSANGWSGVLGDEALGDDEKTDPALMAPPEEPRRRPPSPEDTIVDPVMAAMLELDGPEALVADASPDTQSSPAPIVTPAAEAPRLFLPLPGGGGGAKPVSVPAPTSAPAIAPALESPSATPEFSGVPDFSADDLMDRLSEAPPKPEGEVWTEYKGVALAAIGGVVLIASAFLAQHLYSRGAETEAPVATVPVSIPVPTAPKKPVAPPVAPPAPVAAPPKATAPVVSVVSSPKGALVEINGLIYGKTPLILPSPTNVRSLSIVLKLDRYRQWEGLVRPNEAGHFAVNVELEPQR